MFDRITYAMFSLVALVRSQLSVSQGRRRAGEAGYSTEMVVVTAAMVVLAIAVTAVIAVYVMKKANGLPT